MALAEVVVAGGHRGMSTCESCWVESEFAPLVEQTRWDRVVHPEVAGWHVWFVAEPYAFSSKGAYALTDWKAAQVLGGGDGRRPRNPVPYRLFGHMYVPAEGITLPFRVELVGGRWVPAVDAHGLRRQLRAQIKWAAVDWSQVEEEKSSWAEIRKMASAT